MAQETSNELLLLAILRHQVGLQRFAGSVRERVFELLDATEADLERAILLGLSGDGGPRDIKRLKRLLLSIRAVRGPAWQEATALVKAEMLALVKAEPGFMAAAVSSSAPVALDIEFPSATLLAVLARDQPLEGRTVDQWMKDLVASDEGRIMSQVRIGMVQGESVPQIVRRVMGSRALNGADGLATGITRRGVAAVVRTFTNGLANEVKREFFLANSRIISAEVWVSTLDGRTCQVCMGLDGRKFPVGEGRVPPAHVGCRCVRVAVLDGGVMGKRPLKPVTEKGLLREFSSRNGIPISSKRADLPRGFKGKFDEFARRRVRELTGTAPAKLTYSEFLRKQSRGFQEDVLGKTRARLFRSGQINLRRFTDRRGDTLTLRELASREGDAFRAAGLDPENFI